MVASNQIYHKPITHWTPLNVLVCMFIIALLSSLILSSIKWKKKHVFHVSVLFKKVKGGVEGEFIQEGDLFDIMAHNVGTFLGEAAY